MLAPDESSPDPSLPSAYELGPVVARVAARVVAAANANTPAGTSPATVGTTGERRIRIGLQFPTREESVRVTREFKRLLQEELANWTTEHQQQKQTSLQHLFQLCILGDTDYGHCCVDELSAHHYDCDFIIHFGHTCLSLPQRIPTFFCLVKKNGNGGGVEALEEEKDVSLSTSPGDHEAVVGLQKELRQLGNDLRSDDGKSTLHRRLVLIYDAGLAEAALCAALQPDLVASIPECIVSGEACRAEEARLTRRETTATTPTAGPATCSTSGGSCETSRKTSASTSTAASTTRIAPFLDAIHPIWARWFQDVAADAGERTSCGSLAGCGSLTTACDSLFQTDNPMGIVCGRVLKKTQYWRKMRFDIDDHSPSSDHVATYSFAAGNFRYVYVGGSKNLLQTLLLRYGEVTHVELPETAPPMVRHLDSASLMLRRYSASIEAIKRATHVGLLFATADRPKLHTLAAYLEKKLQNPPPASKVTPKATYRVSIGKVDVPKLCNMEEVDCWVVLCCPERFGEIVSRQNEFPKPFVSAYEVMIALGLREWEGDRGYIVDITDLGREVENLWHRGGNWNCEGGKENGDEHFCSRTTTTDTDADSCGGSEEEGRGCSEDDHEEGIAVVDHESQRPPAGSRFAPATGSKKPLKMLTEAGEKRDPLLFDNARRAWRGYEDEEPFAAPALIQPGMVGVASRYQGED